LLVYYNLLYSEIIQMENSSKSTPLEKKIALLTALREGNIEKSHLILQDLAKTSKTKP